MKTSNTAGSGRAVQHWVSHRYVKLSDLIGEKTGSIAHAKLVNTCFGGEGRVSLTLVAEVPELLEPADRFGILIWHSRRNGKNGRHKMAATGGGASCKKQSPWLNFSHAV